MELQTHTPPESSSSTKTNKDHQSPIPSNTHSPFANTVAGDGDVSYPPEEKWGPPPADSRWIDEAKERCDLQEKERRDLIKKLTEEGYVDPGHRCVVCNEPNDVEEVGDFDPSTKCAHSLQMHSLSEKEKIACNQCNEEVKDIYWMCSVCNGGDWRTCQECIDVGKGCLSDLYRTVRPASSFLYEGDDKDEDKDEQKDGGIRWSDCDDRCKSCGNIIEDAYFHCRSCNRGDYNLCLACVDLSMHCHGSIRDGMFPDGKNYPRSVDCDLCKKAVGDYYFHCSSCRTVGFSRNQDVAEKGRWCLAMGHGLVKRFIRDGKVVDEEDMKEKKAYGGNRNLRIGDPFVCNACEKPITTVRFHCSYCDRGNFEICQECVGMGRYCLGQDHKLFMHYIQDHEKGPFGNKEVLEEAS